MKLSACGLICDECEYYEKECNGCIAVSGQTFWAKEMMPNHTCPLYNCAVNEKGFAGCGHCHELPCDMFRQMKDPNSTDEEHELSLVQRVSRLKQSV
jgi:hypothetical protein